jgi:hypothetical protein
LAVTEVKAESEKEHELGIHEGKKW